MHFEAASTAASSAALIAPEPQHSSTDDGSRMRCGRSPAAQGTRYAGAVRKPLDPRRSAARRTRPNPGRARAVRRRPAGRPSPPAALHQRLQPRAIGPRPRRKRIRPPAAGRQAGGRRQARCLPTPPARRRPSDCRPAFSPVQRTGQSPCMPVMTAMPLAVGSIRLPVFFQRSNRPPVEPSKA